MAIQFNFGIHWVYKGEKGGERLFNRLFTGFRENMKDWSPAFHLIADDILTPFIEKQFESEGAAGGLTWAELAPSTMKNRGGTTILYRSGSLLHSFIDKGRDHVEEIEPRKLVWGSTKPYALFHQTGTQKGYHKASGVPTGPGTGRGMPMRKIISLTDDLKQGMANAFIGRGAQISRQVGFGVTGDRGLSPLTARMIGQQILGDRGF